MALHSANGVTQTEWLLSVPAADKEALYHLRHWTHLRIGSADGHYWVAGLTGEQLKDPAIYRLLHKQVYTVTDGKLYPQGRRLPARPVPAVLWTPIDRALPVSIPAYTGNYANLPAPATLQLVQSEIIREPVALLVDLRQLEAYVKTAPAVRLKPVSWVVIGKEQALLTGTPLLPVSGTAFWARTCLLLPAGYDLNLPVLANWLNRQLCPSGQDLVLWTTANTIISIPAACRQPLSRQTVHDTLTRLAHGS